MMTGQKSSTFRLKSEYVPELRGYQETTMKKFLLYFSPLDDNINGMQGIDCLIFKLFKKV